MMAYVDQDKARAARRKWYVENKQSQLAYKAKREQEMREWIRSLKVCCSNCPEDDAVCLDFHHRENKEVTVAATVKMGWSKDRILKEIEKCDVLCSNCHRKLHASVLANG